ncbi:DUF1707 SHOCT-like domain-containing protein [Corynebacterium aquatimens]|uniref:Cell wall-active antibiotics response LiaF-like C-terminal domain-containing protein n=1 Tax=Corynebacterium aquatimens TaxID=1190508 RepID=A0A931E1G0_9CORY|nr:DUF1707 domain-containing protein [Corynebacterium aquatimens]MBG6122974.1 hypothetical protein [Corynebacterium aquatimens]WJY66691.1 hypothetical protein CAQUA_10020 [Corynebacterium aquatimens]
MSTESDVPAVPEPNNLPRKRASQAQRTDATDFLAAAYADGQLNTTEFDERTSAAWNAVFADELEGLTRDLVPVDKHEPATRSKRLPDYVTGEPGGVATSIAVMGGVERSGDWLVNSSHTSFAFMGGTEVNLLKARLSSRNTTIRALAFMGGVEIIVPEDVHVKCDGTAFMGGFGVTDHRSVTIAQADLPADAPTITITGFALMGGVEVIRANRDAVL